MSDPIRVVVIFLVDARGRVLLQERDEHAPVAPDQWGLVGGHVEPGEGWADAMRRELAEETGLVLPDGTLRLWHEVVRPTPATDPGPVHWQVWVGRADLTDDDIVVGEGRQIVFLDPAETEGLDLAESTRHFLPVFLSSEAYAELSAGRSRG
jgi:8-oxo-dGTP pyrophosphatase MutT (NUDIX family)